MKHSIKFIFSSFIIAILLQACTSTPLQSSRLNSAEDDILQAEQALSASKVKIAENYLGTAAAYLATVEDYKNRLSSNEKKKYQGLRQREVNISRMIQSQK
jgi:hypothetical protein